MICDKLLNLGLCNLLIPFYDDIWRYSSIKASVCMRTQSFMRKSLTVDILVYIWKKNLKNFTCNIFIKLKKKTTHEERRERDEEKKISFVLFFSFSFDSPLFHFFFLVEYDSNLVDSASSHTLVSKIKPCMSKYKRFILWNCEWLII